jgi:hypothetical protein
VEVVDLLEVVALLEVVVSRRVPHPSVLSPTDISWWTLASPDNHGVDIAAWPAFEGYDGS